MGRDKWTISEAEPGQFIREGHGCFQERSRLEQGEHVEVQTAALFKMGALMSHFPGFGGHVHSKAFSQTLCYMYTTHSFMHHMSYQHLRSPPQRCKLQGDSEVQVSLRQSNVSLHLGDCLQSILVSLPGGLQPSGLKQVFSPLLILQLLWKISQISLCTAILSSGLQG